MQCSLTQSKIRYSQKPTSRSNEYDTIKAGTTFQLDQKARWSLIGFVGGCFGIRDSCNSAVRPLLSCCGWLLGWLLWCLGSLLWGKKFLVRKPYAGSKNPGTAVLIKLHILIVCSTSFVKNIYWYTPTQNSTCHRIRKYQNHATFSHLIIPLVWIQQVQASPGAALRCWCKKFLQVQNCQSNNSLSSHVRFIQMCKKNWQEGVMSGFLMI